MYSSSHFVNTTFLGDMYIQVSLSLKRKKKWGTVPSISSFILLPFLKEIICNFLYFVSSNPICIPKHLTEPFFCKGHWRLAKTKSGGLLLNLCNNLCYLVLKHLFVFSFSFLLASALSWFSLPFILFESTLLIIFPQCVLRDLHPFIPHFQNVSIYINQ